MSLATIVVRPCTIQTGTSATDRYNNTITDWSSPTERASKVWFAQQSTIDDNDHRTATITRGAATFLLEAALVAGERVVLDGVMYDVVGEPNYAPTPRGQHHIEAQLVAVVG